MANRKYLVVGVFPAYGVEVGETVHLDPADVLVQANINAGVIELTPDQPKVAKTTCPACIGQNIKRPPSFASEAEMVEHYGEKHPALVVPEWKEG
jgi:hypothetical protein